MNNKIIGTVVVLATTLVVIGYIQWYSSSDHSTVVKIISKSVVCSTNQSKRTDDKLTKVYGYNKGRIVLLPDLYPTTINSTMSSEQLGEAVQLIVNPHNAVCSTHRRFGNTDDGGWDVCLVGPYIPRKGKCLIMSFGINNEWKFDDEIANEFQCNLFAYDPTMKDFTKPTQRTKYVKFFPIGLSDKTKTMKGVGLVKSLKELLKDVGKEGDDVDILKMDIEWSEWDALRKAMEDKTMAKVKQLLIEFHLSKKQNYGEASKIQWTLHNLKQIGFLAWNYNWNTHCSFISPSAIHRTQCNEVYFININYLDTKNHLHTFIA